MINGAVAAAFERIADLMEITGESGFRINSYRRVARLIRSLSEDVAEIAQRGELTGLEGVGKASAQKIIEFIETGRIRALDDLESKVPSQLPDLLRIPGLGPKKIAVMHRELGVAGIDDLARVIESGELADLAGFGAQSVERIREGIAFLQSSGQRVPRGLVLPIAESMADALRSRADVIRVELAGSLRRGAETIGDVDILCAAAPTAGKELIADFVAQPAARRVLAKGETKGSITVEIERGREMQVDLRVVDPDAFGAALQYFTGSKEHNVRLRELAARRNLRLNEYGLYRGDKRIAGKTEESIYAKLDMVCVPPEIREDAGEFDLDVAPTLVTADDIRGDLHMHTTASDGKSTIDEMVQAAKNRGYQYIAITDHSGSSVIANGLDVDRMVQHIEAVRDADRRHKGITVFAGCECDILPDGTLDYPGEILSECDLVVASVHAAMRGGDVPPTRRILNAMENRYVTIIGHPTGRLIGRRPPMELDMAEIIRVARQTDTALEINASWQRLDLKDHHVRQATEAGVFLAVNTDSHHADGLGAIEHGIVTARRGWATPDCIINTRPLRSLKSWIARKRG